MLSDGRDVRCLLLLMNRIIDITAVPSFGDQEMLPQVTAFMLESLRWRPVSIGGALDLQIPCNGTSDTCPRIRAPCNDGCHMEEPLNSQRRNRHRKPLVCPKECHSGGIVIILRAIANDPEVFPNPEKFDPQRWFTEEGKLRDDLRFCTFGFGRR